MSQKASSSLSSTPACVSQGDTMSDMNALKCEVMVNYLHQQQEERLWTVHGEDEGVVLKKSKGTYVCCPAELLDNEDGFVRAVQLLNVRVAMTVNTKVVKLFLHNTQTPYVPMSNGLRLQVLPDMSYLPRCQKHHFAAFIGNRSNLIVWDDNPRDVLGRAERIQAELLEMIWQGESAHPDEKHALRLSPITSVTPSSNGGWPDLERGTSDQTRKIVLWQPTGTAFALLLTLVAFGSAWRLLAIETAVDSSYLRLAFMLVLPIQIWLGLFFFQTLVTNFMQILGPVDHLQQNSKFYTGIAPKRLDRDSCASLPHVTIQMPVYKEGLEAVIEPTIRSIKCAISTYEMQGGTANIFVNDDGMQLLSDDDARMRQDFYDEHNIGWVARPKHNPKPVEGEQIFHRRGKFKKASNMNYALWVSNRAEEKLESLVRPDGWTEEDETSSYREVLRDILVEDDGATWADGNIRVGDYILLIDSDTRVPVDCLFDAVSEMEQSPQVAIVQFASGVMNITENFFENGITFFTNLVYTAIRFAVASGDVAPFIGHNAVLRWSVIQEISFDCPDDHRKKFWSETTVSEDFDMALRLQSIGYHVRLAVYSGEAFKEGVSLTVYDELSRWEKYAYGCAELIFHPLRFWIVRGPFTPLFRQFITSCIPLPSKITIMAYVGTYYAIGSTWLLVLVNYFIIGWQNGFFDHYYLESFQNYFGIIVVFGCLGNVSLAILRYRNKEKPLVKALVENFKWIPLLTIFLGGISLHVSQAITSYLFGIDMSWGATAKEAENTSFFREISKVLSRFKFTFIFTIGLTVLMIILAQFVPPFWQIKLFIAIYPLATMVFGHFFLPIALNPNLMLFTW